MLVEKKKPDISSMVEVAEYLHCFAKYTTEEFSYPHKAVFIPSNKPTEREILEEIKRNLNKNTTSTQLTVSRYTLGR